MVVIATLDHGYHGYQYYPKLDIFFFLRFSLPLPPPPPRGGVNLYMLSLLREPLHKKEGCSLKRYEDPFLVGLA